MDLSTKSKQVADRIIWNRSKLTEDNVEYLRNLLYCYEFYMSGRLVRLFHATPEKIHDFIGNIDTIDRLYKQFLPSKNTISNELADVVVYGHIHTPFIQKIYNRTIINTGSVGNYVVVFRNDAKDGDVRNTTFANYFVISGFLNSNNINQEISYELISVPYDIDKELEANTDNIELEAYEKELRTGKYRDMSKVYKIFKERGFDKDKI